MKGMPNMALHWMAIPLRSIATSELGCVNRDDIKAIKARIEGTRLKSL
jgi:hypothetical protein